MIPRSPTTSAAHGAGSRAWLPSPRAWGSTRAGSTACRPSAPGRRGSDEASAKELLARVVLIVEQLCEFCFRVLTRPYGPPGTGRFPGLGWRRRTLDGAQALKFMQAGQFNAAKLCGFYDADPAGARMLTTLVFGSRRFPDTALPSYTPGIAGQRHAPIPTVPASRFYAGYKRVTSKRSPLARQPIQIGPRGP